MISYVISYNFQIFVTLPYKFFYKIQNYNYHACVIQYDNFISLMHDSLIDI